LKLYLITTGTGRDGDEWRLHKICATPEIARRHVLKACAKSISKPEDFEVEEWELTDQ